MENKWFQSAHAWRLLSVTRCHCRHRTPSISFRLLFYSELIFNEMWNLFKWTTIDFERVSRHDKTTIRWFVNVWNCLFERSRMRERTRQLSHQINCFDAEIIESLKHFYFSSLLWWQLVSKILSSFDLIPVAFAKMNDVFIRAWA